MTIITAIHDGTMTWLGYNDGWCVGDTPINTGSKKWMVFGNWALGIAGNTSQKNYLEYHVDKLKDITDNPFELVEQIRGIFSEGDRYVEDHKSTTPNYKISAILAHKNGGIWDLDRGLSIDKLPTNKLWARGSGVDYALGASDALEHLSLPTESLITKATQAAINCDLYCPGSAVVFRL